MSGGRILLRAMAMAMAMALGLLPGLATPATQASAVQAERRQIADERKAIEQRFKTGEAACRERFVVTACVDEQQAQRRKSLDTLLQREMALDEAKRKSEAEENARRLEAKRAAALNRPAPVPRAASAPDAAFSTKPAASAPAERVRSRSKTADDAATAAERVVAQQRRASEAAAHREAVEQRNAQRAARGKKSSPLGMPAPLPPASAASR